MANQQQQAKPKDSTSTEYIRQRLANQQAQIDAKRAQLAQQQSVIDDADAYIDKKTADRPDPKDAKAQQDLHKRAEDAGASSDNGDHGKSANVDEEVEEEDEQRSLGDRITAAGDAAASSVQPLIDRIAATRTPTGIGALLVVLGILLLTVVVVNKSGDTRLKQIWYMLNGQATLIGRKLVPSQQQGGSSSGTFSTTSSTGTGSAVVTGTIITPSSNNGVVTLDTVPSHGATEF